MALELEVYKREDPTVRADILPFRINPSVMSEMRGTGAGSFSVHKNDPKILQDPDLLNEYNIIKVRTDGEITDAFVIQNKSETIVEQNGEASRMITCRGEGLRTWFRHAILYPMYGFKKTSGDSRFFSFASEQGGWYNPSNWTTPVNGQKYGSAGNFRTGYPADWPNVPNAYWIWDRAYSSTGTPSGPLGTSYFRYEFDLAVETPVAVFMAADDYARAYMDAELIIETSGYMETWTKTWSAEMTLAAGHHIFAVKMENNQGPAGLIAAIRKFGDPTQPTSATNISYTGQAGWKMNAYPATEPGWTSGEVLLKLLAEAQARNVTAMDLLVPTFTNLVDSNGVPWADIQEWEFEVGIEYIEIIDKLEELGCEIWIDPVTYQLHAVKTRGTDRSVVGTSTDALSLRIGKNLIRAEEEISGDVKNVLAIRSTEGWVVREDSAVGTSPFGRVEGTFSTDATINLATKVANVVFQQRALPEVSTTYGFMATSDIIPDQDVFLGDYVLAPDSTGTLVKRRIVSITKTEDAAGNVQYACEFDAIFKSQEERLQRWLEMISKGRALGGKVANSSLKTTTTGSGDFKNSGAGSGGGGGGTSSLAPDQPISLIGAAEESWTSTGTPYFRANLGWDPVTTDVNGNSLIPAGYLIWARANRVTNARQVRNLSQNPNFETGTTGVGATNVTAAQSADWVKLGTRSLKLTPTAASTDSYVTLDSGPGGMRSGMTAGNTFTATAVFYQSSTQSSAAVDLARTIQIVYVSTSQGTVIVPSAQAKNITGEQTLSVTVNLPADTTEAYVRLYNGTGTGAPTNVYFDTVMIVAGSKPVTYFDGSFANNDNYTYTWTGTANASASLRVQTDQRYVIGTSEENGAVVGEFYPGEKYDIGVMAISPSGALSALSAEITITFPSSFVTPPAGTTPGGAAATLKGTASERDIYYGIPGTQAQREALAGSEWFDTNYALNFRYYADDSDTGVPPNLSAASAGWYPADVRMPYCLVQKSAAQTIATTTTTLLTLGGASHSGYDPFGMWSAASPSQITVPFSGMWRVTYKVRTTGSVGMTVNLRRSGSNYGRADSADVGASAAATTVQDSSMVFAAAGAYFELWVTMAAATSQTFTAGGSTYLEVQYMGPVYT